MREASNLETIHKLKGQVSKLDFTNVCLKETIAGLEQQIRSVQDTQAQEKELRLLDSNLCTDAEDMPEDTERHMVGDTEGDMLRQPLARQTMGTRSGTSTLGMDDIRFEMRSNNLAKSFNGIGKSFMSAVRQSIMKPKREVDRSKSGGRVAPSSDSSFERE